MSELVRLKRRPARIVPAPAVRSREPFPDIDSIVIEREAERPVPPPQDMLPAAIIEPAPDRIDEEELRTMTDAAYQRGWRDGVASAESRFEDRLTEARQDAAADAGRETAARFDGFIETLQVQVGDIQRRSEEAVIRLALSIAEQIVKRELRLDQSLVLQQVREAIQRVVGVDRIKIRVHPADEAFLREHRSTIVAGADSIRELVIEGDGKIEQGGCILESESGNVDARIATQLKKIETLFVESNVIA